MKTTILFIMMGVIAFFATACNNLNDMPKSDISVSSISESVNNMKFKNIDITGIDISVLSDEEKSVLYTQARYCQAMTDSDIETMREIVSEDMIFTHMSGRQQSREEYFADIKNGKLRYFTIGIENPAIEVSGSKAVIEYTSVLNANAYGARGTYRMTGKHHYEKRNSSWILVNG